MSVILTLRTVNNTGTNSGSYDNFNPINGSIFNTTPIVNQGGWTVNNTSIVFPEDGYYCLMTSIYLTGGGSTREAPAVRWRFGGVDDNVKAGPTYIRDTQQGQSSIQFTTFKQVTASTSATLAWARWGNTGTITMQGGQSMISIWKVG
jgi:hypothetical protein